MGDDRLGFGSVTSVSASPNQVLEAIKKAIVDVHISQLQTMPLYMPKPGQNRRGSIGTQAYEDVRHMTGGILEAAPFWKKLPIVAAMPDWYDMVSKTKSFQTWVTEDCEPYMRALGERYARFEGTKLDTKDELFRSDVNGRLVTHSNDGKLKLVENGDLVHLFDSDNPKDWPQVVLTASHALARDEKDVADIMKGFHRLISNSGEGKTLKLLRNPEKRQGKQNGDRVVMAAAIDAGENAWINGANLIKRCTRIRHMQDTFVQNERRNAADPFPDDYIVDMSPAAVRLGRQILSTLIVEKDFINLEVKDADWVINGGSAHLRSNAAEIAKHFTLVGYSKGGNVVSDAVRYVTYQLAHLPLSKEGESKPLAEEDIADVVKRIQLLSVAVARHESPLSQTEKRYGMHRTNVVNKHDIIASPFDLENYELDIAWDVNGNPRCRDLIIPVDGPKGAGSHDPVEAMGDMDDVGQLVEGYLTQNTMVKERLEHMFGKLHERSLESVEGDKAPNHAAISQVHDGTLGEGKGAQRSA